MRVGDVARYALTSLRAQRLRIALMLTATAIGVAAVIVLSALGDGARRYVVSEFAALGTHLLIVFPGRTETTGGLPPIVGETPRDLTIEDALALLRSPAVRRMAPMNVGTASISVGPREREAVVLGTTADFHAVRHLDLARGQFLPAGDARSADPLCVLGAVIERELFGTRSALGEWVRLGDRRFRVVGTLAPQGHSIGVNLDEVVIIPIASAQALFNNPSLLRILVESPSRTQIEATRADVIAILRERHEGEEDVTVVTQDSVLRSFDRILRALTLTVAGIAAISLTVAGVLIMNVMLVAVAQRQAEIGLLKAVGATRTAVLRLFIVEAGLLSSLGGVLGLALGAAVTELLAWRFPALPFAAPTWAIAAALGVAVVSGVVFGLLPARRAAALDPVQALARR